MVMMNRLKLLMIFLLLLPAAAMTQDEVAVEMYISPDTIDLYGEAMLAVSVKGPGTNLPDPQVPNLAMFEVYSRGSSTNISMVNGRVESTKGYNYLIVPKKAGTFTIKPAAVVYDRHRYESNEVTITVVGGGARSQKRLEEEASTQAGESRDVFLTAGVSKKKVYVNEQVTLTIKFYNAVRLLSQPDYTPPQTTDFWADMIEPQKSYYQVVNGRRYKVTELQTALFPTRAGELSIGSAMVSVTVSGGQSSRRTSPFSIFDDFFDRGVSKTVRSHSITITAMPLPEGNKPDDFTGTVGDFTINSTVDKTTVEINQPITVKYKISGTGNIKTVAEPRIEESTDFRVYRASSDEKVSKVNGIVGGTKIFEETYIPKRSGRLTIPGVKLTYFNPAGGEYHTVSTRPINITSKAPELADYENVPLPNVPGHVIDPKAKDIRYIKMESGDLEKRKPLIITSPVYLAVNGIPVLFLAAAIFISRRREKLASDIGYARSRAARKMARRRLSKARKLLGAGKTPEFFAEIRLAIFAYIADRLNISPHGLTGESVNQYISQWRAGEETREKLNVLLRQADFAQYSSARTEADKAGKALKEAENILIRLEGAKIEKN